ncbi:MAG: redoxin domain-containing protein [Chthonomonas sp.]|nr:redoxin domain-containing protein [Chthonomonas sp.]
MRPLLAAAILCFSVSAFAVLDDQPGHSKHGSAFDSGMRTKPWEIEGVGNAPFPITSKNPEVQKWFNQGNALLHSFWFEEAERSFRWCLKLDPDCAMAYLGLAMCGFNWFSMETPVFGDKEFGRYKTFLKEAVKRKDKVTPRELMYIEAYEAATAPKEKERVKVIIDRLNTIAGQFPDDLEARAQAAFFNIGKISARDNEKVIQSILAKNPMHPGAHHASIHNWDGRGPVVALDSCVKYSEAAPGIGHAMHMPGHIYSKIGMWHEAAIAMDSATRIELKYMNDRLALPFETWNYPHNRNYLCYIQEQLGRVQMSLQGARDMLTAPRDPEYNAGPSGMISGQGGVALTRALIKFERWDEILAPGSVPWDDSSPDGKFMRAFTECFAYIGLGKTGEARDRLDTMKKLQKAIFMPFGLEMEVAEALIGLAEGRKSTAMALLTKAADDDDKQRKNGEFFANDPPFTPWTVNRILGDVLRAQGDHGAAITAYEKSLVHEPNDAFTLSGLALSHHALGNIEKASYYAGRLEYVWSGADEGLKWLTDVRKLGLNAKPIAETPAKERTYNPKSLDKIGTTNWRPFAAPKLEVKDVDGKPVSLKNYAGKNVILVFFLGEACVHCVGQLKSINDKMSDFEAQDTVVLGVCSASPESLKASTALGGVGITFLSDTAHENARRFSSYDDFEDMELHSTILIDKEGKIRWKRTGGDPFMKIDFLLNELKRINQLTRF